ncbi:MAG: hypothetical protein WCF77_02000, partial [Minisyncoccia bacterium]
PWLLRGQDSDLLRELMGLPGKPFPTLPPYFSMALEKYGEVRTFGATRSLLKCSPIVRFIKRNCQKKKSVR